jgi:hypothetical protein
MPKRARSPEEPEEQSSGSFIDLLEYIRPAFFALMFFMNLVHGFSSPAVIVISLNGQGRLMVSQFSFYEIFRLVD